VSPDTPAFKLSPAISFFVKCSTQDEADYDIEALKRAHAER
jgi:predicted 3-demethylubiquinone-9 3-methyltransferase (glyoxalase superfamily)